MSVAVWLGCALIAVVVAAWAYGAREERVSGRSAPAAIRALAIFLILGGLSLPSLGGRTVGAPTRVALLDLSRSMSLPARPGAANTRLDSARAELRALNPDRIYVFGDAPTPARLDSIEGLAATHDRSRLEPAIQAARLGGADSVWVITDGDLLDRAEALAAAQRLGLGIREIRTSAEVARVGVADLRAPDRARSGDTVRVTVELVAGGDPTSLPDSVSVELRHDDAVLAMATAERPAPGRTGRVELSFVPSNPDDEPVWQRLEAVLVDPVDPLGVSDRAAAWVEVSESAGGAVMISTDPDWEARFLVPALGRLVLGGAHGFLRLQDGRYVEMSAGPRIVDEARVRRALRGSRLLVVQGAPESLPGWLATAMRNHSRVLTLAKGPGEVPGAGVRVSGPLPGEWYATPPIPASPASGLLLEADLDALPPVRDLYALDPPSRWTILNANRNRRGEGRPLLSAGERGDRRWAVSAASEWWRWALRGGAPKRVYEAAFSGIVGWLVEGATPQLAALEGSPAVGRPPVWRVRPGASDLEITLLDDAGAEVWREVWSDPPTRVTGPALELGTYEARIKTTGPDGVVEFTRPIEIAPDARELLTGPQVAAASIAPVVQARSDVAVRAPRPVWPFVLAVALLCVEWVWRHRIGLR